MIDYTPTERRVLGHLADEYVKRLKQAEAMGWRLDTTEAKALVDLGVQIGHIDPARASRLAYGLTFGEYMLRRDGKWACTTCGGNCGQCGNTDLLGNIGLDFDRLVALHSRQTGKPVAPGKLWNGVASAVLLSLALLMLLIALAGCATRDGDMGDIMGGGIAKHIGRE